MDLLEHSHFAVVPAAGRSRRMGCHKLLLPWKGARVIDIVLEAWTSSRNSHTVVVVRSDDRVLQDAVSCWPVTLLPLDVDPPDMKSSIQQGLEHIRTTWSPTAGDRCLFAPADMPGLTSQLIDRIIDSSIDSRQIVAPRCGTRCGHPVSFPWEATSAIFDLGCDEGIDSLIARSEVKAVPWEARAGIQDIDTPNDYKEALRSSRAN